MSETPKEIVKRIETPIHLTFQFTPGVGASRFLRGIAEGKILGLRCTQCAKVYVSPRGSCPKCGAPTIDEAKVTDRGTITSFSIVRVPSEGIDIELPFVCASILLDGADNTFYHVVREVPVEEVRMGMRVAAVWVPKEELRASLESIRHFKPTGEPDAPFDSYKEHL